MALSIAPLFSGSKGNCILVATERTKLLIDAGYSCAKIEQELRKVDVGLNEVEGILVTHEHTDHIAGIGVISRKYDIPVYANEETWCEMTKKTGEVSTKNIRIIDEEDFYINDMCIQPYSISHDAARPFGYSVVCGGKKVSVMTDLGKVTDQILKQVEHSNIVLLESNHDIELLKNGRYPYYLKKRILSGKGHLSNEAAGAAAGELAKRGVRGILLGHLSRENNRKLLAYETVFAALKSEGIEPGRDLALGTTRKSHVTGFYTLK